MFLESKGKAKLLGREKDTVIEFLNGDFLNIKWCDWTVGDVVFVNSTCFDDTLMSKISDRASKFAYHALFLLINNTSISVVLMKKGSFLITVTKRIPSAVGKLNIHCL